MLTIADFDAAMPTHTVKIRGKSVVVHGLTMDERRLARDAAGPMPAAPVRVNPSKGTLARPEPDETDHEYRVQMAAWGNRISSAEVVLAVKWKSQDEQPTDTPQARVLKGVAEMNRKLNEVEMATLHAAIGKAEEGGSAGALPEGRAGSNALKN